MKKKQKKNKTIILFCTPDRKISFSHLVLRCYAWISVNQCLKSCWLKYRYKNIQFVTWLINNLIFCLIYKVLCLLVFVRERTCFSTICYRNVCFYSRQKSIFSSFSCLNLLLKFKMILNWLWWGKCSFSSCVCMSFALIPSAQLQRLC